LRTQLASTIWNKQRTSYERNQDGHGDVLDADLYKLRNLPRNANPIPPFWQADPDRDYIPEPEEDEESERLSSLFS
jgi:hypothetical protein